MEGFGRPGVEIRDGKSRTLGCSGFEDGIVCSLGGWKHVNFCVCELVEDVWRRRVNVGRREHGF